MSKGHDPVYCQEYKRLEFMEEHMAHLEEDIKRREKRRKGNE